nr:molybdopterin dinucleotide binding domain-containing protein [Desulfurivibrio alkaliphilus]
MEEIALLTPIYGGIYHDRLAGGHGLQWPCWDRQHPGTPFLHKYYFTRGRGRFAVVEHQPPAETPDADYPLLFNTGRAYHHYHTGSMTRRSAILNRECRRARLQINPQDANAYQVTDGEPVRLHSRRGQVELAAELTDTVPPGMVYGNFHFAEAPINNLTTTASDRRARCPEYKICAVRLEKISTPTQEGKESQGDQKGNGGTKSQRGQGDHGNQGDKGGDDE